MIMIMENEIQNQSRSNITNKEKRVAPMIRFPFEVIVMIPIPQRRP